MRAGVWLLAGWGCGQSWGSEGDTSTAGFGPSVVSGEARCDPEGTALTVTARTDGWVGGGEAWVLKARQGHGEGHPMALVASDPGGAWDELEVGPLADGVPEERQVAGVDTRFDCVEDADRLSFAVVIRGGDDAPVDCVVWGVHPDEAASLVPDLQPALSDGPECRLL